jgi:prepilin signal peptidase PulO-like enzyme (type II secretory pathway)
MHPLYWLGIGLISLVMGQVVAGLIELAIPSLPFSLALLATAIGCGSAFKPLSDIVRTATAMTPDYSRQFG